MKPTASQVLTGTNLRYKLLSRLAQVGQLQAQVLLQKVLQPAALYLSTQLTRDSHIGLRKLFRHVHVLCLRVLLLCTVALHG